MKRPPSIVCANRPRRAGDRGAALVVVLGFVVMLLALLMAYFSRGVLQRQISDASSSLTVENLLAQSAIDTLVSDIRQEIAQGSIGGGLPVYTNPATGQITRVFIPATNSAASPFVSPPSLTNSTGTNATNGMENVLKVSSSVYPNVFPAATNAYTNADAAPRRVAAGDYTTNPSANGRSVSASRWNKPLLISRLNSFSDTDLTPVNSFIPPEWIPVTRSGSNPISWSSDLVYSPTNPTSIIGRYAYIIYNEGGLLDANVAGFPGVLTNPTVTNPAYVPYKTVEGFADLTQIGLSPSQIEAIVGWRNAATAASGGAYPRYSFNNNATNYASALLTNSNGFLLAVGTGSLTDRRFTRRQQLIDFLYNADPQNRPAALTALQSLGTFSRGVVQPVIYPDPTRPKVVPGPAPDYASAGGNDAAGGDDIINPAFLKIRVTNSFTRNDGTPAQIGEPLVKQRFALNRLAWITCKGPSRDVYLASSNDPVIQNCISNGVTVDMITNGTSNNIQKYLGLSWDSLSRTWTYTQRGMAGGSIYTLPRVTDREPDFFELLKAATHVGSLAKGSVAGQTAAGPTNAPLSWQYTRDTSVDLAVLQEGANIIDQYDADSFPIRILFKGSSTNTTVTEIRGVEDLPYIYRVRLGTLNAVKSGSVSVNTLDGTTTYEHSANGGAIYPTSLTNPGAGILLAVPEVWNPHDANGLSSRPVTNSLQPGSLRIVAATTYPENMTNTDTNTFNRISIGVRPGPLQPSRVVYYKNYPASTGTVTNPTSGGQVNESFNAYTSSVTPAGPPFPGGYNNAVAITTNSSSLTFSNATNLYREPTLLAETNVPQGSFLSMTCNDTNVLNLTNSLQSTKEYNGNGLISTTDALRKRPVGQYTFTGIYLGMYPLQWVGPRTANATNTMLSQVYTGGLLRINATPYPSATFQLQYLDALGRWVTYDEKYCDLPVGWIQPDGNLLQDSSGSMNIPSMLSYTDPRTGRFGAPNCTGNGLYVAASPFYIAPLANTNIGWLDATNNVICTERPDYSAGFGSMIRDTQGWYAYAAAGWHVAGIGQPGIFFQQSLLSQNNPMFPDDQKCFSTDKGGGVSDAQFYTDADGVVRRAMGAYVTYPTTLNTGLPLATATTTAANGGRLPAGQSTSRPVVLNRPFRNVAELGFVFSGKPWKNIDFFTPESGDSALLDLFTLNPPPSGQIVAGLVDLNTRQRPVLASILFNAYRDPNRPTSNGITAQDATNVASLLATYTVTNKLASVSDLVGRWKSSTMLIGAFNPAPVAPHNIDGAASYTGYSALLTNTNVAFNLIKRFREAPIRSLTAVGQTRVWNIMADIIVQTGKIPPSAGGFNGFLVKGEARYWVHIAIDRYTGQVIDKQIEVVHE